MFRALIVSTWGSAIAGESGALMQSQNEFVNNKERVQLAELHKQMSREHEEHVKHAKSGGYRNHLTKHSNVVEAKSTGHMERLKKTAREMEHEYRAILELMVQQPQVGNDYTPPTELLSSIETLFDAMEGQLVIEAGDHNQGILDANAKVQETHDLLDTAHTKEDGIDYWETETTQNRGIHKTCRTEEDVLICDSYNRCQLFNKNQKNSCQHEQNWYAKLTDPTIVSKDKKATTLATVIQQAESCRNSLAAESVKAAACDAKQGVFEESFCKYAHRLQLASDNYDLRHTQALAFRNVLEVTTREEEKDNKLIWQMIKKVECYIDVMKNVDYNGTAPTQEAIDACITLVPSTTELDVDYVLPVAKTVLDLSPIASWPGDANQGFTEKEYISNASLFYEDCKNVPMSGDPKPWQLGGHEGMKLKNVVVCTLMNAWKNNGGSSSTLNLKYAV